MPSDLWHKYIQAYKILSIHLFFYPFYPSIYLYSVYPIIHPSINLTIYPSNQQLMHASIQPFIDLFIYSTIILFIDQSIHTLYIQIHTIQTYTVIAYFSQSINLISYQLQWLKQPISFPRQQLRMVEHHQVQLQLHRNLMLEHLVTIVWLLLFL